MFTGHAKRDATNPTAGLMKRYHGLSRGGPVGDAYGCLIASIGADAAAGAEFGIDTIAALFQTDGTVGTEFGAGVTSVTDFYIDVGYAGQWIVG